jgi:uncharacterized membrane protein
MGKRIKSIVFFHRKKRTVNPGQTAGLPLIFCQAENNVDDTVGVRLYGYIP